MNKYVLILLNEDRSLNFLYGDEDVTVEVIDLKQVNDEGAILSDYLIDSIQRIQESNNGQVES